jgi:hypothetical protein
VNVQISGVPASVRTKAEGLIRGVLGTHPRESTLHVHATRFANGEWLVFITDLDEIEIVDGDVADRVRAVLHTLPPI